MMYLVMYLGSQTLSMDAGISNFVSFTWAGVQIRVLSACHDFEMIRSTARAGKPSSAVCIITCTFSVRISSSRGKTVGASR